LRKFPTSGATRTHVPAAAGWRVLGPAAN